MKSRLVLATLALAASLAAQTHHWIAPGPAVPPADWHDPANWDVGTVPDSPDATAILAGYATGVVGNGPVTTLPGTAPVLIASGSVDLAELRWQLAGGSTQTGSRVQLGTFQSSPVFHSTAGELHLHGAGLAVSHNVPAGFVPATVEVVNGNLEFHGDSSSGEIRLANGPIIFSGASAMPRIFFRDQSTAGTSPIFSGGILSFFDDASAAQSDIQMYSAGADGGSTLSFFNRAAAGTAQIMIGAHSSVYFNDQANAQQARITAPLDPPAFGPRRLQFSGQSSAGSATIQGPIPITFSGQATAGAGAISIEGNGSLLFGDEASAGMARIATSGARITFAGSANAAASAITLGGDAPPGSSPPSLVFRDQASTGSATVNFAANATVDFSGLFAAGVPGGTGRSSDFLNNEVVVANDAVDATLAGIAIAPGVTDARVSLGSNRLVLGANDGSIPVLPRLLDGGISWSGNGRRLGGGGLTKRGTGVVQITRADNLYTGETRIEGGELRLLGGNISGTRIAPGATLSGTGIVLNLVNASGTVSPGSATVLGADGAVLPGHPAGTLSVFGDFAAVMDGPTPPTLRIDITPAGPDRLAVSGHAAIGGRLQLHRPDGYTPVGDQSFTFITAASLSGQFSEVISSFVDTPLMRSRLVQSATGMALEFDQQSIAALGANPAGRAFGAYLDAALPNLADAQRGLIAGLNAQSQAATVSAALEALAPDRYGALPETAFVSALAHQSARERLVAGGSDGFELEFSASHLRTELRAAEGLPDAPADSFGGLVGARWRRERFAAAFSLAQERTDLDLDATGSRAESEGVTPAVTLRLAGDRWFAIAGAARGRHDYDLRRRVVFSGLDQMAVASASGTRSDLSFLVGARVAVGTVCLAPHAGLFSSRWDLDGFTESGASGAALAVEDWTARSLRTRVGVDLNFHAPHCAPQGRFVPRLSATWWHELDDDRAFRTRLVGAGSAYLAPGRTAETDLVQVQAGLDWRLGPRAMVSATAGGAWGKRSRVHTDLALDFRWRF